jgi:CheY-like chemotaxis protein
MSPAGFADPEVPRAASHVAVSGGGANSVLIVDDDPGALRLMQATLRPLGHSVMGIANPADALAAIAQSAFAVVVMDVLMPNMDGFELLDRIRALPSTKLVPVIVWTVKDLSEAERKRLLESAQGIVAKSQGGTEAIVAALEPYLSPVASTGPGGA